MTVTFMLPTIAMSLAGIAADSAIVLMNVVVSDLPLKLTTDFGPKFAPFIVSVKRHHLVHALPRGSILWGPDYSG